MIVNKWMNDCMKLINGHIAESFTYSFYKYLSD
jgi:hypothetical protein